MSTVKLFISYKDRHKIIKSDIIQPIQTGRAISDEIFEDMIGDDTGDNISVLNKNFCELSAIYWAWKNYNQINNPDYIGFMHYRRHFLFGDKNYNNNFYGLVRFETLTDEYLKEDLTSDNNIANIVADYDAIIPQKIDVFETTNCKNNYEHYKKFHNIKHLNSALKILEEKYPEYSKYIQQYKKSKYSYFLLMFVMKKDLFFEYCEWLFSILFELRYYVNQNDDKYQSRAIGFIAERLTTIFFYKLYEENKKIKELPVSFINNVDNYNIQNMQTNNTMPDKVVAAICINNNYTAYCSVFLDSLIKFANKNRIYEINILGNNITKENKELLKRQTKNTSVQLVFHEVSNEIVKFKKLHTLEHISKDTYSRFLIPEILNKYDKCIYLDTDTLIQDDIAKLFDIDLENKSLGASTCATMQYIYHTHPAKYNKYINNILNLESYKQYFQAGILVMNLKKMRENNDSEQLIQMAKSNKFIYADQCILNKYYKNDIKYIDNYWNYETEHLDLKSANFKYYLSIDTLQKYLQAKASPKIIHYAGCRKPWLYPDEEFAKQWWKFARQTPYYEEILKRMNSNQNVSTEVFLDVINYKKNIFKYWKYKLLRNIVFGKKREKYIYKKGLFKHKLNIAKTVIE